MTVFAVLMVVILFAVAIVAYRLAEPNDTEEWALMCVMVLLITGIVGAAIWYPVIGACGGFCEGYSTGSREGYLTKTSYTGWVWKTNEAQIQVGTGEMAALQEPFCFSIPDEDLMNELSKHIGKKVRISYTQWIFQPFSRGGSGYELLEFEILEEK